MRQLSVIFFTILVSVGCSTDEQTLQLIEQAESVMIEHPDSALNIIRSVDAESIRGEEDMAHYRLAMAEVMYHNDIYEGLDSLTTLFYDYYLASDDHAKRARALYQHALVLMYDGEKAKSMYSLIEAEKSLVDSRDHRLIGNVYLLKGEVYSSECLFDNGLEAFYIALKHFKHANLRYHLAYTQYRIGETLSIKEKYAEAETYLRSALDSSLKHSYEGIASLTINQLSQMYVRLDKYSECSDVINLYEEYNIHVECLDEYYYLSAILESNHGNRDKAIQYTEAADNCEHIDILEDEYYKYLVYRNLGDTEEALYWLEQDRLQQQKLMLESLELPIINIQVEALEKERVLIAERAKLNKICLISVIVVLLLVIVAILLYMRYHNVKKSRDIANYISIIAELEQSLKSATKNESSVNQNADIIELNKICEIYYQYGNTSHLSSKIIAEVSRSIESIKTDEKRLQNLENIVNLRNHNVLSEIIESCPKINNKEYRYIIYNLLGFSSRSMAMLLDIDTDALARLKYKVKAKLRVCENAKIKNLIV